MSQLFKCIGLVFLFSQLIGLKCEEDESNENIFNKQVQYQFEDLRITVGEKIQLEIISKGKNPETKLLGELGVNVPPSPEPAIQVGRQSLRLDWGPALSLEIKQSLKSKCHTVVWTSDLHVPLEDCYQYGTANWFGGPEVIDQHWPVEKLEFKEVPYITQMYRNMAKSEPYWLNSKGVYIYVDRKTPLFIDSNNHRVENICFIANDVAPYLKRKKKILEYNVCGFSDPRKAQEHAIENFMGKPSGIPDVRMVEHPIWSTWVRDKWDVNETSVLKFAEEIVRYGFNNSQIEIDDNWETCYGSTKFNTSRFPNMKELSVKLKKLGFRITIWVHPFINLDCPDHSKLRGNGYFVKNISRNVESVWWDGDGSGVDFTNPDAVKWFRDRHNKLMTDNGIDGLKFDAGETSWLPQIPLLNCPEDDHPKAYTAAYVDAISQFSPLTELRVTHHTQQYPMFVRMIDKDSKWTFENGLPTAITTMLVMNLQGYPWVLPDMVGGNAYGSDVLDKEIFIRWLQANTFMPSIQFSAAPWDFDYEAIEISKKFTELHFKYSSKIVELMKKTVRTGAPLNPPIWWVDPTNPTAHKIASQYLLGEDILVAPILKKGAVRRNIYLPKGYWKDENHPNTVYKGRRWLKNYYADLSTLPYFTRVNRKSYGLASRHGWKVIHESETVFES